MSEKDDELEKSRKNADKDSVDRLPLSGMPLNSKSLKKAKLVKNARMETSLELHQDALTGSLQILPSSISDFMEISEEDKRIIHSLSNLQSFDVYSLRKSLKKLGLEVEDVESLELSDNIKKELESYSLAFVRPLVEKIFAGDHEHFKNTDSLNAILTDPDVHRVKANLSKISEKTGIALSDIPTFLEEYSDVFLSVAYYKYSFEDIGSDIERFLMWMKDLSSHREITSSSHNVKLCKNVIDNIKYLSLSTQVRLVEFQKIFEQFWNNINRDAFNEMRFQIEEKHGNMGAVLCGLVVKMHLWRQTFKDDTIGGPATRLKFIMAEIEPGLAHLRTIDEKARKPIPTSKN